MIRRKLFKKDKPHESAFRWRNHEIFRIETFSDAVFGFAITLLVVSLEVPETFHELLQSMYGMIGFAISFLFLFMIWHYQYLFFRYFGLNDLTTIVLNGMLLFVVLFYVYPLKFLFTLLTIGNEVDVHGVKMERIANYTELRQLMIVYCAGVMAVYITFILLFMHAGKKKKELRFSKIEEFQLRTQIYKNLILVSFGAACIVASLLLPDDYVSTSGMLFMFIYPAFVIFFKYRNKKIKALASPQELQLHHHSVIKSRHAEHSGRED